MDSLRYLYDNNAFFRFLSDYDVAFLSITLVFFFIVFFQRLYITLLFVSLLLLFFNIFFIAGLPLFPFQFPYMNKDFPLLIRVLSLVVGVWGLIHSIKDVMVTILRSDAVVDSWNYIVEQGAGKGDFVYGTIETLVIDARMPGVTTRREEVAIELFGEKRPFLIVQHARYKEFKMYINARNFGSNLDVSWYFMAEPHYLKRTMSKYATGNPQDLAMRVSLFAQQDISAFKSVTHNYVKRTLDMLLEELNLEPSSLNTGSRGFLSVW